jgi:hypothetical protein
MEVIDIDLGALEPININLNEGPTLSLNTEPIGSTSSLNSGGGGMELLMNDRKRSSNNSVHVDLGDIDQLEKELNQLSGSGSGSGTGTGTGTGTSSNSSSGGFSGMVQNLFGFGDNKDSTTKTIHAKSDPIAAAGYEKTDSKLGQSTASALGQTQKTWDGYTKASDVPDAGSYRSSASLSEREKRAKKREMINKMREWSKTKEFENSTQYTMDSNFDDVEEEYNSMLKEKRRKESVKMQGWWLMTFVNTLEFANSAMNPFDINLDGFGEKVSEDLGSYDEIFGELHDKYQGGKLSPEVALLLKLGISAATVSISNKALSSAAPGFNDIIKQSPELMRAFTDATVKSMSSQSPGFAFANNMMNTDINNSFGPPPKPVETKSQPAPPRPGAMQFTNNGPSNESNVNRPDLAFGRGAMFKEQGVPEAGGYMDVNRPNGFVGTNSNGRQEMRGPQTADIDSLLSGLKTKTVNIHESVGGLSDFSAADESMVSVSSLKDLAGAGIPKRSGKRKGNSMNTVSLDI